MFRKPDLFIIGAQKAGTTSLKNYLGDHPEVITHPHTEMTFYADEKEFSMGFESAFVRYFGDPKTLKGEKIIAKNVTISFREETLQNLRKHNPDCKIVFVLREPISRAYSAYQMAKRGGWMHESFDYALKAVDKNTKGEKDKFYRFMLDLGIYHTQIETLLKYYPREQIKFLLYDDLKSDPVRTTQLLYSWLHVDSSYLPNTERYNQGGEAKSKLMGSLIKFLRNNGSIVKNGIKNIFGERSFIRLSQNLQSLNKMKSPVKNDDIDDKIYDFLKEFYFEKNQACSQYLDQDLNQLWYG